MVFNYASVTHTHTQKIFILRIVEITSLAPLWQNPNTDDIRMNSLEEETYKCEQGGEDLPKLYPITTKTKQNKDIEVKH